MKILGIDTSCDDTSVAIVEDGNKVLYKDVLKPKTNKKFTLRIWVSDKYQESTDNLSLSFKVDVKGTTKDMEWLLWLERLLL